jgi:predicted acetyltransferase
MAPQPLTPSDTEAMTDALTFKWVDRSGSIWERQPTVQHKSPVRVKYRGDVLRDGKQVGVFTRNLRFGDGGLEIEHVNLHLADAAKGHGFATAVWSVCLDRYRDLGLARVTFTADSEGKLFWARGTSASPIPALGRPSSDGG